MLKRKSFISVFFLFAILPFFGETTFSNLDINLNDEVLFTVKQNNAGSVSYKSLFVAKIKNGEAAGEPDLITCFPEQMELLNGGNTLQIRNRFGTARYDSRAKKLEWVSRTEGIPTKNAMLSPYAASPDGKYYCHIEKTGICTGALLLTDSSTGKTEILNEDILNSYTSVPVKWAKNSSVLIYEKDNAVYFCNPEAVLRGVEIDEKYRKIGRGNINSVCWASEKYLAYVDDYLLYRINTRELYTLGLYSGIIGQGKAMARLPFQFDSQVDKFFVNSDVTAIVVNQNQKLFSYLKVQSESCDYMDVIYSRPYTDSTASLYDAYVLWNTFDEPILWQEKLPYDGSSEKGAVYKLDSTAKQVLEIQDSGKPSVSPNGNKVAFFAGSMLYVYDVNTLKRIAQLGGEKITAALWLDDQNLIVGGERSIRKWNCLTEEIQTITLSSATAGYWNPADYSIIAEIAGQNFYRYNKDLRTWEKVKLEGTITPQTQNGRYRIFTGTSQNSQFANALYIRSLSGKAVTKSVYSQTNQKSDEKKKVCLVFDMYDNSDGLPEILSILKKYNIKGTFFLNGEFIRRYPFETKQIALSGHNCASMFFTTADLTENSFVINEDFVRRGLARNEDEFYSVSKNELMLFWHAPFYKTSPEIISYGNNAGYTYVNSNHEYSEFDDKLLTPEELITKYFNELESSKGGIVPVVGGFSQGNHAKPLYNYLDILISVLIDGNFEFVQLNEL